MAGGKPLMVGLADIKHELKSIVTRKQQHQQHQEEEDNENQAIEENELKEEQTEQETTGQRHDADSTTPVNIDMPEKYEKENMSQKKTQQTTEEDPKVEQSSKKLKSSGKPLRQGFHDIKNEITELKSMIGKSKRQSKKEELKEDQTNIKDSSENVFNDDTKNESDKTKEKQHSAEENKVIENAEGDKILNKEEAEQPSEDIGESKERLLEYSQTMPMKMASKETLNDSDHWSNNEESNDMTDSIRSINSSDHTTIQDKERSRQEQIDIHDQTRIDEEHPSHAESKQDQLEQDNEIEIGIVPYDSEQKHSKEQQNKDVVEDVTASGEANIEDDTHIESQNHIVRHDSSGEPTSITQSLPQSQTSLVEMENSAIETTSANESPQQSTLDAYANPMIYAVQPKVLHSSQRFVNSECYFNDGIRTIDLVLAFKPKFILKTAAAVLQESINRQYRNSFERKLIDAGLELERAEAQNEKDQIISFVKLHAKWQFLATNAQLMQMQMPIAQEPQHSHKDDSSCAKCCSTKTDQFENLSQVYFRAPFDNNKENLFLIQNRNNFFTPIQRMRIIWFAIERITVPRIKKPKFHKNKLTSKIYTASDETENNNETDDSRSPVSLNWMLNKEVYKAVFPIHDSDCYKGHNKLNNKTSNDIELGQSWAKTESSSDKDEQTTSSQRQPIRNWLSRYWAGKSCGLICKYQPIDTIRDYFGEHLAFYFAWLGFYTKMLWAPAILGLICFFYGFAAAFTFNRSVIDEVCQSSMTICRQCPLIEICPYEKLKQSCPYAKIAYIFDNELTIAYGIFISIWAVLFVELWKRKQRALSIRWTADKEEFHDLVLRDKNSNGVKKTQTQGGAKCGRVVASTVIVVLFLCVVCLLLTAIAFYRIISVSAFYKIQNNSFVDNVSPSLLSSITAAIINVFVILIMNIVYKQVALALTELEKPRTQEIFEASYIYKVVIFQFANYFGGLIYVALIKGKYAMPPNEQSKWDDRCNPLGCMPELFIMIIFIMIGKQIFNLIFEIIKPLLSSLCCSLNRRKKSADKNAERWEKDYLLAQIEQPEQCDAYIDQIIQYGFLIMFSTAFPIAAAITLIYNAFKIRVDANKLISGYRRPIPKLVNGIGPWLNVFEMFTIIGVIINALVLAFTSDFVDRCVYWSFYSPNGSLDGYLTHIFTLFNTTDYIGAANDLPMINVNTSIITKPNQAIITHCYFRGYYSNTEPHQYDRTITWWHVIAARLAFVLAFEHLILLLYLIMHYLIPKTYAYLQSFIDREKYVVRKRIMGDEIGMKEFERIYAIEREAQTSDETVVLEDNDGSIQLHHVEEFESNGEHIADDSHALHRNHNGQPQDQIIEIGEDENGESINATTVHKRPTLFHKFVRKFRPKLIC